MRYLTIAPDYSRSCIKDDFNGFVDLSEMKLPQDFIEEIFSWHLLYKQIIPLSIEDREKMFDEIDRLDQQGLRIADRLRELAEGGAKVKYYSEGRLKYLY